MEKEIKNIDAPVELTRSQHLELFPQMRLRCERCQSQRETEYDQ